MLNIHLLNINIQYLTDGRFNIFHIINFSYLFKLHNNLSLAFIFIFIYCSDETSFAIVSMRSSG